MTGAAVESGCPSTSDRGSGRRHYRSNRLDGDTRELPRAKPWKHIEQLRDQRKQIVEPIRASCKYHDSDRVLRDLLLILQVLVRGEENVELPARELKELAVRPGGPATFGNGRDLVALEVKSQIPGKGLIE